jgi:phage terminase large subunit-like protein
MVPGRWPSNQPDLWPLDKPGGWTLPSTYGAHNPSLGYSPRKRDIETIQALKARSIGPGQGNRK